MILSQDKCNQQYWDHIILLILFFFFLINTFFVWYGLITSYPMLYPIVLPLYHHTYPHKMAGSSSWSYRNLKVLRLLHTFAFPLALELLFQASEEVSPIDASLKIPWVISHVPMFHITQPWSVYGLLDGYFFRWCPIYPSHGTFTNPWILASNIELSEGVCHGHKKKCVDSTGTISSDTKTIHKNHKKKRHFDLLDSHVSQNHWRSRRFRHGTRPKSSNMGW